MSIRTPTTMARAVFTYQKLNSLILLKPIASMCKAKIKILEVIWMHYDKH